MPPGGHLQQGTGRIIYEIHAGDSGLLHRGGPPAEVLFAWFNGPSYFGVGVLQEGLVEKSSLREEGTFPSTLTHPESP